MPTIRTLSSMRRLHTIIGVAHRVQSRLFMCHRTAALTAVFSHASSPKPAVKHNRAASDSRTYFIKTRHETEKHVTDGTAATSPPSLSTSKSVQNSPELHQGNASSCVQPVAKLLSLNQIQRMLRRVPVGTSSSLFHYNELPSNVQGMVPSATLRTIKEIDKTESRNTGRRFERDNASEGASMLKNAEESTSSAEEGKTTEFGEDNVYADGFHADKLLVLHEPQFAPSETALFTLFRKAIKAREAAQRQQQRYHNVFCDTSDAAGDSDTDYLQYLRDLEEPCLLLPDTQNSTVALGLTTSRFTVLSGSTTTDTAYFDNVEKRDTVGVKENTTSNLLDDFYLGLVTACAEYRVDYSALPHSYVLGVPTDLLNLLMVSKRGRDEGVEVPTVAAEATTTTRTTCPARTPVDLSRWVVYDDVSGQFLLRRRAENISDVRADEPLSRASTGQWASAPDYVSLLEEQVFLAHTYSFDPKSAYEAALAVHGRTTDAGRTTRTPLSAEAVGKYTHGYTLFFFHFARSKERPFFGSAQNAGLLYPSCFYSYMSEVPTTQKLAVDQEEMESSSGAGTPQTEGREATAVTAAPLSSASPPYRRRWLADSLTPSTTLPFFIAVRGKRFHIAARAATEGGGAATSAATSWTAQAGQRGQTTQHRVSPFAACNRSWDGTHGQVATFSSDMKATSVTEKDGNAVSVRVNARDYSNNEDAVGVSPRELRARMGSAFKEWKEILTARATIATTSSSFHRNEGVAVEPDLTRGSESGKNQGLLRSIKHAASSHAGVFSLEDVLDAERCALLGSTTQANSLARSWERGWRLLSVPIAVASPIVYEAGMSLYPSSRSTPIQEQHTDRRTEAFEPSSDKSYLNVSDAPLADAVWKALYLPQRQTNVVTDSSTFSSLPEGTPLPVAYTSGGGAVLPLAEDRLATARYRVLLPFLRTPRRVLPAETGRIFREKVQSNTTFSGKAADESVPVSTSAGKNGYTESKHWLCCPALWRVGELEALCGWRRHRSQFLDAFGSFSGLLNHDLYITLGRQTPAFASFTAAIYKGRKRGYANESCDRASRDRDPCDEGKQMWNSPVVWINDVSYVRRVLLPAMHTFAKHTSRLLTNGLYVYRGGFEELSTGAAQHNTKYNDGDVLLLSRCYSTWERRPVKCTEEALAVGVHHRLLVESLRLLQHSPPDELQAWLAASPDDPVTTRVMSQRTGISEACLTFFSDKTMRAAASSANPVSDGKGSPERLLSSQLTSERVAAFLSLTPADIAVVPFLDFLVWASLCSDFSEASRDALRCHAAAVRSTFTAQDCVMAVKYCAQYPSLFCVDGGNGLTVALAK